MGKVTEGEQCGLMNRKLPDERELVQSMTEGVIQLDMGAGNSVDLVMDRTILVASGLERILAERVVEMLRATTTAVTTAGADEENSRRVIMRKIDP